MPREFDILKNKCIYIYIYIYIADMDDWDQDSTIWTVHELTRYAVYIYIYIIFLHFLVSGMICHTVYLLVP